MWRFKKLINGTVALAADINNDCSGKEVAVLPSAGGHTGVTQMVISGTRGKSCQEEVWESIIFSFCQ